MEREAASVPRPSYLVLVNLVDFATAVSLRDSLVRGVPSELCCRARWANGRKAGVARGCWPGCRVLERSSWPGALIGVPYIYSRVNSGELVRPLSWLFLVVYDYRYSSAIHRFALAKSKKAVKQSQNTVLQRGTCLSSTESAGFAGS